MRLIGLLSSPTHLSASGGGGGGGGVLGNMETTVAMPLMNTFTSRTEETHLQVTPPFQMSCSLIVFVLAASGYCRQ